MIEDLVQELESISKEKKLMQEKLISIRKSLWDTESKLIELNINYDRLKEKIRVMKNSTVNLEISERDIEIEKFRKQLPELLKKIEEHESTIKRN